jgi:hypothetical protein
MASGDCGKVGIVGSCRITNCFGVIAAAGILAVAASGARADDDKDSVKVTVVAVLASSQHTDIDKRLKDLAPELKKKDPSWTGFEVERSCAESMKIGEPKTFTLTDDFKVTLTLTGRTEKGGAKMDVAASTIEGFSYSCCCSKYFPFDAHFDTKSKKRLVVAVMVEPCEKKK